MTLNDAVELYICTLSEILADENFRKKGTRHLYRNKGECIQDVCVLVTKIRGTSSINLTYNVSYSYPNINKIASYLQGIPYRKEFATGCLRSADEPLNKIKSSHLISEKTIEQDIKDYAYEDARAIVSYYFPLLDKCDTAESFLQALDIDRNIANSFVGLGLLEWIKISTLLYLGKKEEALLLFDEWIPREWFGKKELSEAHRRVCRRRIESLSEGEVPNDGYALFGRQGDGTVIPLPED